MLTGRRPFEGPSAAAVVYEIAHGNPAPVSRLMPSVHDTSPVIPAKALHSGVWTSFRRKPKQEARQAAAIEQLIMRLLEKDPAARPQDAGEVESALENSVSAPTVRRSRPTMPETVVFLALLLLAGFVAWNVRTENRQADMSANIALAQRSLPSVAVMPFVNTSGDPADEPFADGLTDELIGTLGKMPGLRVTARSSVFALKGRGLGARTIADTLGVEHLLEGSIRRSGNRLRVNAQLVSARDGSQRWSETYDREVRDVFELQQEMARAMATALQVRLVIGGGSLTRPTEDSEAFELYLKGRYALHTRSREEDLRRAVGYFEQALARDSSYAQAWSGLSDAYTSIATFGYDRPGPAYGKAKSFALRALALDSTLAEARTSLAHVLFVHEYEWEASERELLRAIAQDPGYTHARLIYSVRLQSDRRYSDAIAQLDTARSLDPLRPALGALLGRAYVNAGMPDEAITALRGAIDLNPQADLAWQQLGHAYLLKDMPNEAIAALRRAAELSGMRDSAHLAYAYAVTGHRDTAQHIVRELVASSSSRYVAPFHIAMAYAGLGDVDESFRWLERAYEERGSFVGGVGITAAFKPLHGDPRWDRLLRRMGRPS
jgi:serine/threonine-protein kinase